MASSFEHQNSFEESINSPTFPEIQDPASLIKEGIERELFEENGQSVLPTGFPNGETLLSGLWKQPDMPAMKGAAMEYRDDFGSWHTEQLWIYPSGVYAPACELPNR
jgi:hypothetical protein